MLERLDVLAEASHHPDALRVAAWYHGSVYRIPAPGEDPRRFGEDHEAGAARARFDLTALGVPEDMVAYVETLVANIGGAGPRDVDCAALCDADLAVLATTPQKYRDYRTRVREEYRELDPRCYLVGRLAALERLQSRPAIFRTPAGKQWEESARQNLSSEQAILETELAELDPDGSYRTSLLCAAASAPGVRLGSVDATAPTAPEARVPASVTAPGAPPAAPATAHKAAAPVPAATPAPAASGAPAPQPSAPLGSAAAEPRQARSAYAEADERGTSAPADAPTPQRRSLAERMAALDCPRTAEDDFSTLETCLEDLEAFDPRPPKAPAVVRTAATAGAAGPVGAAGSATSAAGSTGAIVNAATISTGAAGAAAPVPKPEGTDATGGHRVATAVIPTQPTE
ncbi:MAG: hypothetical protein Q3999_04655 [Buchananella hordeovulneris]|nr:hypothetical protein [Buchananella hordeovulneris]